MLLKKLLIIATLILPALACAEPQVIEKPVTKLQIPEAEVCQAQLKYAEYQKTLLKLTADAYRRKLKELGWNCFPKESEIQCITEEEKK